jgi:hypothetical protein
MAQSRDDKPHIPTAPRKLLGAGLASVTAGILLFIAAFARFELGFSATFFAAINVFCALVLYRALTRHMKSWAVFLGIYGFLASLLFLLIFGNIILFSIKEFWPLLVLFCGVCLIASGFYGKNRLAISYMVPALLLIALGFFFLLFSTDIIQVTLSSFVAKWLPVGLVLTGIVLLLLFFFRAAIQRALFSQLQDDDSDDLRSGD